MIAFFRDKVFRHLPQGCGKWRRKLARLQRGSSAATASASSRRRTGPWMRTMVWRTTP